MPQILLTVDSARVKCTQFHPKRPWILMTMHDGFVEIWDYVVKAQVDRFLAHSSPVRAACFHPTQSIFATGADDRTIKLWDLESRKLLATMSGHTDYIRYLDFHPGAHPWLASAADDGVCRIWNWQSRQCLASIVGHREFVMCCRFHPTDDILATVSMDTILRVWDLTPIIKNMGQKKGIVGAITQSLLSLPDTVISVSVNGESHSKGVNWVCWAPEDQLYTSSDDTTVKAWRLNRGRKENGQLISADAMLYSFATITGHRNNVNAVEIGRDNIIISACHDETLRIYEAKSRNFVGALTVQDFGQPHNEQMRFWCLNQHPTEPIWAAGHDNGMVVFKFIQCKSIPMCGQFFIRNNTLLQKQENKESNVMDLVKNTAGRGAFGAGKMIIDPDKLYAFGEPFPYVVLYNDGVRYFWQAYLNAKLKPQDVVECSCAPAQFKNLFIYVDKAELKLAQVNVGGVTYMKDMKLEQAVRAIGFIGAEVLVSYNDGRLVLLNQQLVKVKEISLPLPVSDFTQAPDSQLFACKSENKIFVMNNQLQILSKYSSATPVASMVFGSLGKDTEQVNHTLCYSNRTHIGYLCCKYDLQGIITSLNRQVYLKSVLGQIATFADDEGLIIQTSFDARLCGLLTAIADGRQGDAQLQLKRVLKNNLGIAAVSKLIQAGISNYAIQLLGDEYSQLKQSLSIDLGILEGIKDCPNKDLVVKESMLQNRGVLAYKYANAEQKAYLNAIFDSNEKIDYKDANTQQKLNAQILNNDEEGFLQTLLDSKMVAAATVFAKSRGLNINVQYDQKEMTKPISVGKKLEFKRREQKVFDWPMKKVVEIEINEKDIEEKAEEKVEIKNWENEKEESSPKDVEEKAEDKKEKREEKKELEENESSLEENQKIPAILNAQSQAMKQLGFSKNQQLLTQTIEEVKESVNESGQLPFTAQVLDKKLKDAYKSVTDGEFQQAYDLFVEVHMKYKMLIAQGTITQKQINQVMNKIYYYMRALKAEIVRKDEKTEELRHPELLIIFAAQKLEPLHRILVLKLAMNKLKKSYGKLAKMCALELVKIVKEVQDQIDNHQDLIDKAEKVLSMKDTKGDNQRMNNIESLEDIQVDWNLLQIGVGESECTCCGCHAKIKEQCTICKVGEWM